MSAMGDLEERLASRRKRPASAAETRVPVMLEDLAPYVTVLGLDAALGNTGWIALERWKAGINVPAYGTIRTDSAFNGYRGVWDRAGQLEDGLRDLTPFLRGARWIALEAPPVGGGSIRRTDSSLMAGREVTRWAGRAPDYALPCGIVLYGPQEISAALGIDPRLTSKDRKAAVRETVIRLIPEAVGRDWNEHIRDAAAAALACLVKLKKGTPLCPMS